MSAAIHRSPVRESRRAAVDGVLRIVVGALVIIVLAAAVDGVRHYDAGAAMRIIAGRDAVTGAVTRDA
ncbi:hypothetical protein ACNAW0_06655 [Micromonospora sp. SL1-18]|uniref:hypothetical protein n=1 Tax=Micromonospora sp. SL1-18 TaxID=3399128 RepID=UPI003A4D3DB8